jgi:1,4-alpha-glucan branching enzyme
MAAGRLCLVLHAHIPYVLHHGQWPHGESWLYEAAAETYLPLLDLLNDLADRDVKFAITVGLTPVLLEQLADPRFVPGFIEYCNRRIARAADDEAEFTRDNKPDWAALARRWQKFYKDRLAFFEQLDRDIPAAFADHHRDGRIEILTSAATHAFLPLLGEDGSITAQIRAGQSVSRRVLGIEPTGIWLPECGYRPADPAWHPPVLFRSPRARTGLETFVADAGLTHFFVDTPLIARGKPLAVRARDSINPTSDVLVFWDNKRGWGSPLDPVGVGELADDPATLPKVAAFARHPQVSEQVWSAVTGYPGADDYLEFHDRHGDDGFRYRRITGHHIPAEHKDPYDPAKVAGRAFEQATHFCSVIRKVLGDFTKQTGRIGTVVAPFDAELFGHWWFEGFTFLKEVLLQLHGDGSVDVTTPAAVLAAVPPDKIMALPAGSWGEGGGDSVWLNDKSRWMWEAIHRAEDRFRRTIHALPWKTDPEVAAHLIRAARELLLLQSSDWPFVIHSNSAVDYGITRFSGHVTRFDRLCTIATDVAEGRGVSAVQATEIAEADAHDLVFADLKLEWWE